MARPIRVNSVAEEENLIVPCVCGGRVLETASDEVALVRGRWFDALVVVCASCGRTTPWLFDITSFFEPHPRLALTLATPVRSAA